MKSDRLGAASKLFVVCLMCGFVAMGFFGNGLVFVVPLAVCLVSGAISGLLFYKEVFKGV